MHTFRLMKFVLTFGIYSSKRVSGFDMAPPASAMLAGAAAVTPGTYLSIYN